MVGRRLFKRRGSDNDAQVIAGARIADSPFQPSEVKKVKGRVPPTLRSTPGASHDPALFYQVEDEEGTVRTFFETHPAGNRKVRRYTRRHDPKYTKKATGGRDWQALQRAQARRENENTENRDTDA